MQDDDDSRFGRDGAEYEGNHSGTDRGTARALRPCPRCHSLRVASPHRARRIIGALGTIVGAIGAASRAWSAAEVGAGLGTVAGPPGALFGAVAGAVLGALAGGATGSALGIRLGEIVDSSLLNNLQCLDCDHRFSSTTSSEP